MNPVIYRYRFKPCVALQDVEETLLLGVLAAEGLYGAARIEMDVCYRFDRDRHACAVDAHSDAGRDVARIFTNLLRHEFGADAFEVTAVDVAGGGKPLEGRA
jgi:hypothetical protein